MIVYSLSHHCLVLGACSQITLFHHFPQSKFEKIYTHLLLFQKGDDDVGAAATDLYTLERAEFRHALHSSLVMTGRQLLGLKLRGHTLAQRDVAVIKSLFSS
jgi:hypothetical protein